ncbi:hypothetical protein Bca101_046777 [Brassica carinata]
MKIKTRGSEDTREIRSRNRRVGAAVQASVPTMFCLGFFRRSSLKNMSLMNWWRLKEIEANKQFQEFRWRFSLLDGGA